jgi:hypothetical protein
MIYDDDVVSDVESDADINQAIALSLKDSVVAVHAIDDDEPAVIDDDDFEPEPIHASKASAGSTGASRGRAKTQTPVVSDNNRSNGNNNTKQTLEKLQQTLIKRPVSSRTTQPPPTLPIGRNRPKQPILLHATRTTSPTQNVSSTTPPSPPPTGYSSPVPFQACISMQQLNAYDDRFQHILQVEKPTCHPYNSLYVANLHWFGSDLVRLVAPNTVYNPEPLLQIISCSSSQAQSDTHQSISMICSTSMPSPPWSPPILPTVAAAAAAAATTTSTATTTTKPILSPGSEWVSRSGDVRALDKDTTNSVALQSPTLPTPPISPVGAWKEMVLSDEYDDDDDNNNNNNNNKRTAISMQGGGCQCPLCHRSYPQDQIEDHASECTGSPKAILGTKRPAPTSNSGAHPKRRRQRQASDESRAPKATSPTPTPRRTRRNQDSDEDFIVNAPSMLL